MIKTPEERAKTMKAFTRHVAVVVILAADMMFAQVSTGSPAFGSFGGGPFDTVNLGNLNLHFSIPVLHKAGRGMSFTYDLSYDSSVWTPLTSNGTTSWSPAQNWGWRGVTEVATGYFGWNTTLVKTCPPQQGLPKPGFQMTLSSICIPRYVWGHALFSGYGHADHWHLWESSSPSQFDRY